MGKMKALLCDCGAHGVCKCKTQEPEPEVVITPEDEAKMTHFINDQLMHFGLLLSELPDTMRAKLGKITVEKLGYSEPNCVWIYFGEQCGKAIRLLFGWSKFVSISRNVVFPALESVDCFELRQTPSGWDDPPDYDYYEIYSCKWIGEALWALITRSEHETIEACAEAVGMRVDRDALYERPDEWRELGFKDLNVTWEGFDEQEG